MSGAAVTIEELVAAFALPPGPPPRRVPKASLADNVPTAADRRLIEGRLARLDWVAAINAGSAGIAAATADGLEVSTVNLLVARTRGATPPRLAEMVHRAIPQPVILVHGEDVADAPAALSLAAKRAAERQGDLGPGRVVVTAVYDSGALAADDRDFLAALALDRLASRDLPALYAALIERGEALRAARRAARPFRLPASAGEGARWRDALAKLAELDARVAAETAACARATRLSARVELGEGVRRLRLELDKWRAVLD